MDRFCVERWCLETSAGHFRGTVLLLGVIRHRPELEQLQGEQRAQ